MSSDSIPTTKLARSRVVGKAMLKIGAHKSEDALKQLFLGDEQKKHSREQSQQATAQIIMESLGELKGVSIKIAQQIALGMPFLPRSYLDEMNKSFQSVPPAKIGNTRTPNRSAFGQQIGVHSDTYLLKAVS